MRFIDSIVDSTFKTTDDGTLLYFPGGNWGKGYILPDAEKKKSFKKISGFYS